jgi:hypothetical protein
MAVLTILYPNIVHSLIGLTYHKPHGKCPPKRKSNYIIEIMKNNS